MMDNQEDKNPRSVPVEWGVDMDGMSTTDTFLGYERKLSTKGRCKRCWGGLLARTDKSHAWTGIRCRVCGMQLEGKKAQDEFDRMSREQAANMSNICFGRTVSYGDGVFLVKIFPRLERHSDKEFRARIRTKTAQGNKKHHLTRNSFPSGSPGLLFMQANILMAGVGDTSRSDDRFVAEFPDMRFEDDGSVAVRMSAEGLGHDPKYSERRLARRMGTTMAEAMIAAFACELAMKAISLTCKDEAKQTHDLLDLYEDLPESCRKRIEADFPEITSVLSAGRQTFGAWRYFEKNVGEDGLHPMIDLDRARTLAKAARVVLDEAEVVGLAGVVDMKAEMDMHKMGEQETHKQRINLRIKGRESPPKLDDG